MKSTPAVAPQSRTLLAVVLLVACTVSLPAQQQQHTTSRIPLEQMASAFSAHPLGVAVHVPGARVAHALGGTAAIAETRGVSHAPTGTSAPATTHSTVLDAFAPRERSALSVGTRRQPHLAASPLPKGMAAPKSLGTAAHASHAPAARAKP